MLKHYLFLILLLVDKSLSQFSYDKEWREFKAVHNISYETHSHELNRRKIFQENLHKINAHNILYEQGIKSYKLGITPFADLTPEEFNSLLTLKKGDQKKRKGKSLFRVSLNKTSLPESLDWRQKGAVTPVKQQGFCGSCWAFSVTGSLEGQYFLKNGNLLSFSEQQLIDCATEKYGAEGCNGGQLSSGFEYIRDYGIEQESDYPYEMLKNSCHFDDGLVITKIEDFVDVESNNEDELLAAVAIIGPVSAAFDAAQFDMQFYKEGIYESKTCSQTELNHGVLIVGYGSEDGTDYWIVKNSWGPNFGIDGYMYMKRGINQCGIALEASYPILSSI